MDLLTIIITVVRRWPVVLTVLVVTVVGVVLVTGRALPEYEATGTLLLHQAQEVPEVDADGAPTVVTNNFVIAEVMNSGAMRARLAEEGFVGDFIAQAEASGILRVVVTDLEPDGLVDTVLAVLDRAREETLARQSTLGSAASTDVFEVLSVPTTANVDARYRIENPEATDTRYVARGSALVTPLTIEQNVFQPNAYTIRVLAEAMRSRTVLEGVRQEGLRSEFAVTNLPRDPAPILYLTTTGSDPHDVIATYERVTSLLALRLSELQAEAGADPTTLIQAQPLASPQEAVLLTTNRTRPAVALSGLGVVAAVSLALVVDGLLARRTARREQAALDGEAADDSGAPVASGPADDVVADEGGAQDAPLAGSLPGTG